MTPAHDNQPPSIGTDLAAQREFQAVIDKASLMLWNRVQASKEPLAIAKGEAICADFKRAAWDCFLATTDAPEGL